MTLSVVLYARPQLTGAAHEATNGGGDHQFQPRSTPWDAQPRSTWDAAHLVELAGRECYDSIGAKGRSSEEYHAHILETGHGSVLEHAQYSFRIAGVSRGLTHELVRHRVGVAFSQRSTRYVDESESEWVQHPLTRMVLANLVALDEEQPLAGVLTEAIDAGKVAYVVLAEALQERLVAKGVDKVTARKQARGAARGYLGNALETSLIFSANVRALLHIITIRGSAAADAEIRELACGLFRIMHDEMPAYFGGGRLVPSPDGIGEVVEGLKAI